MNHRTNNSHAGSGHRAAGYGRQLGLSLVEFLIAIGLGLMIVAALTLLIAQQSATQAEFEKSSRQIENGRYAMQILSDDMRMAGFYGELSTTDTPSGTLPDPCLVTVAGLRDGLQFPVQGYDIGLTGAATGLGTCIDVANHKPGTDILVVRRADAASVAWGSGVAGQAYLQVGLSPTLLLTRLLEFGNSADFVYKVNPGDSGAAKAPLRPYHVHVYYISPCSVPVATNCSIAADGGKPIPTLKMLELTTVSGTTTFVTTPLVEGIENMQIDYGMDTSGDGSPDGQFVATAAAISDWAKVMAVRVHLLARNNESSPGYTDAKTYSLGYNSAASAQSLTISTDSYGNNVRPFKRRLFSQTIRVVNPSARLDQ